MANQATVIINFRILFPVYFRIWLEHATVLFCKRILFMPIYPPSKVRMIRREFKFRKVNYIWIYWIRFYYD